MEASPDFQNAYNLGRLRSKPQWLERPDEAIEFSDPYTILHDEDGNERVESLGSLLKYPSRQKGIWVMGDTDSFCRFVSNNRSDDQGAIWYNEYLFPEDHKLRGHAFVCCVLNDLKDKVPGWCDCYCYMILNNPSETEAAMTAIAQTIKNIPIYKGMPNIELPKSLENTIIDGGKT